MNRKTYNFIIGSLLVSFMLCSPMFIEFVIKNFNLTHLLVLELDSKLTFIINTLKSIIASATFFSGFYFKFSIFPDPKRVIDPLLVIIIGLIFLLIVFIPATSSFLMLKSISKNLYTISEDMRIRWKEIAITGECGEKHNLLMASLYFEETGEKISYRKKNGSISKFEPNKIDIEKRNNYIKKEYELKRTIKTANRMFFFKVFSLMLCGMAWIVLLKLFPPRRILIKS